MAIHVTLKNSKSEFIKQIKVGFSWKVFIFSGFMGIPLLLRHLYMHGLIMFSLVTLNLIFISDTSTQNNILLVNIILFVLSIIYGFKANGWWAQKLLKEGWVFSSPDSDEVNYARRKWGLETA